MGFSKQLLEMAFVMTARRDWFECESSHKVQLQLQFLSLSVAFHALVSLNAGDGYDADDGDAAVVRSLPLVRMGKHRSRRDAFLART